MNRWSYVALVLAVAGLLRAPAQAQKPASQGSPVESTRPVPPPVRPTPFAVDGANGKAPSEIEFRPSARMSERDRLVAANAEGSIAEEAGHDGFALNEGSWNYEQLVCPALPHHLFLQYTRNNGAGDLTEFSAAIPREGDGRVRVIAIRKRGYSLFSPAPINAMTIAAFNRIRAEEPEPDRSENWLGNALCYAALAGGHPHMEAPADWTEKSGPQSDAALPKTADVTPEMIVESGGGEVIRFADAAAGPHAMVWTMVFAKNGKLVKASHAAAPARQEHPVTKQSAVGAERPVPAPIEPEGQPVPRP